MDLPDRPKRSNVFMDANLEAEGQTSDIEVVRIRDISAGGAKVQGVAPDVGTRIVLTRGRFTIPARVVWVGPTQFGVEFDKPINVDEVMKAAGPAKAPDKPVYASALTSDYPSQGRAAPRPSQPKPTDRRPLFGLRVAGSNR
jgi:hypothetical protein